MAFVVYPQSIILFSISFHYRFFSFWLILVIYFRHFQKKISLSENCSKFYRTFITQYFKLHPLSLPVIVPACFHLPRAYLHLHFKASHCVRVGDERRIFFRFIFFGKKSTVSRNFFYSLSSCVKLNGNYFQLTIQRRKNFPSRNGCNKMLVILVYSNALKYFPRAFYKQVESVCLILFDTFSKFFSFFFRGRRN